MVSVKSVLLKGRGRKKRKAKAEETSRKKSEEAKVEERSRTKSKKEEKHPDHHRGCATLSEDIIATEILPRLPPTSLHRFKCVSSSWRSLISDPSFTRLHLDQSRTRPPQVLIAFIDSVNKKEIKFYAYDVGTNNNENNVARFLLRKKFREVQHDLFIVHHCNGLLLLSTKQNDGNDELHICNPSTREFITLPKSTQRDSDIYYTDPIRAGFAFIPDINAYKIARCYEYAYHIRFEVLTLGEASSWRLLPENSPYPIYTNKPLGVSSGEGIYFEIANNLRKPQSQFLCFNLRDEKFYVVDPPTMDIADYE